MRRLWWLGLAVVVLLAAGSWWFGAGAGTDQPTQPDDRGTGPTGAPAPSTQQGTAGTNDNGFKGMVIQEPKEAPDFELTAADGSTFKLSDQRGKVVLVFFGYTHCPDVCPATLVVWKDLAQLLKDKDRADDVRLVFVTVDPERDTPERLREYLPRFSEQIIGLTGSREQLEPVWNAYSVRPQRVDMPESSVKYVVTHPAQVFLIDPEGKLRLLYPLGYSAQDIEHDIGLLLDQRPDKG